MATLGGIYPPVSLEIASFNLLYHGYTKFNQPFHKNPAERTETIEQRDVRYERNRLLVDTMAVDVLLTQEHDVTLKFDDYAVAGSAFVEGRGEGCAVLLRRGTPVEAARRQVVTVDLGEGKTAVIVVVDGFGTFVSLHLKGGPESKEIRLKQLRTVLGLTDSTLPCLIGGDFNEDAVADSISPLMATCGFAESPYPGHTALHTDMETPLALDHFYLRGFTSLNTAPFMVPKNPWDPENLVRGSDHVPLCTRLYV